ncbi:hypothetical protein I7I53_05122 [Histoplasma capsulatum var. duboisii H88]|uniref:Uncharacterized protein n=1 Tax=Ajellomyces capsulatus (strain H88) TaxID=544711 RepID=A0A8A1LSB3_AJEC8|nr:hypothetical protein I7I53_05122 [Histoplasma capsulatum var. duboisii H88]
MLGCFSSTVSEFLLGTLSAEPRKNYGCGNSVTTDEPESAQLKFKKSTPAVYRISDLHREPKHFTLTLT